MTFVQRYLADKPDLVRRAFELGGVVFSGTHRGAEYPLLCPFHDDHNPSMDVNLEKAVYHCWSCGASGDAVHFYALRKGLTEMSAIAELSRMFGLGWNGAATVPNRSRDGAGIWSQLGLHCPAGERYLESRRLWKDRLADAGFLRFNSGNSSDHWVNARAAEGFRLAFAARRPDGEVQTIVLRHAGEGTSRHGKAPTLPGCSTRGVAICRPEISLLVGGDREFEHDEIGIVEGPTSFLAFTLLRDTLYCGGRARPTWVLGCIGASQAASVVESFGPIIVGRVLRVALDPDTAGEQNAREAAEAAHRVGARRVLRCKPKDPNLDVADVLSLRLA